ncbi:hypothetical protein K504DRAFT_448549 [Pleomassaria siparia CBS 279.74]|uniref:Uncharacterized protein n=1 Tax=Pleomassaria siparia CBS 279.74 TaxID=1314801 RepID=A0A6G1JYR1_9PLEO|nr:hypothetical protein K504DRAFT_448549 [Pleomassaria siparia CBS 279.74]
MSNSPQNGTAQPVQTYLYHKIHKKLQWIRPVFYAIFESQDEAEDFCLVEVIHHHRSRVKLGSCLSSLPDVQFYTVGYGPITQESTTGVSTRIRLAELTRERCRVGLYMIWTKLSSVLESDDVVKIQWMRTVVRPLLFIVDNDVLDKIDEDDRKIYVSQHDFIKISFANGETFILDITPDQFGRSQWLYTEDEYNLLIMESFASTTVMDADAEIEHEEENTESVFMKMILDDTMKETEDIWANSGITWSNIAEQEEDKVMLLYDAFAELAMANFLDYF